MVKAGFRLGIALTLAGVVGGCWPGDDASAGSREWVKSRTYERRGPRVMVDVGARRIRDAAGRVLSVPVLIGADGYVVRSGPEYVTRERLVGTQVLVVDRAPEALADRRTAALITRWVKEGGSLLVLARNSGFDAQQLLGAGRVAAIDPSAFAADEFVSRLLAALHWLD
jgi:hypothetical protein